MTSLKKNISVSENILSLLKICLCICSWTLSSSSLPCHNRNNLLHIYGVVDGRAVPSQFWECVAPGSLAPWQMGPLAAGQWSVGFEPHSFPCVSFWPDIRHWIFLKYYSIVQFAHLAASFHSNKRSSSDGDSRCG